MQFPEPNKITYTVYTKSNCSYCDKVKTLLQDVQPPPVCVNCDEYLETCKSEFLEFIATLAGQDYKTFPMVFHGGEFVGGYSDTKLHCVDF
jgi:glutaredoxin